MDIASAGDMIRMGVVESNPTIWADLGCGNGTFTKALLGLLSPGSKIYAIDSNAYQFNDAGIRFYKANFVADRLPLQNLDGIMMANSLHYVADKPTFIKSVIQYLAYNGRFIIVEYDTRRSNPWVPYPVDFNVLKKLFTAAGYKHINKIGERSSVYGNTKMYAALVSN